MLLASIGEKQKKSINVLRHADAATVTGESRLSRDLSGLPALGG